MTATPARSFLATGRGKLTLAVLTAIGFLDFADASIVNIALPDIRKDLHFSVQALQWVLGGYLLTYGGFMLVGSRMAELLGGRRVLIMGTMLFGVSSLTVGFAGDSAALVGSRIAQGLGAALMMPAALSLLTTLFSSGAGRPKAVGAWAGVAALASAAGLLVGGVLTEGPGRRWVLFVNPPIAALLLIGVFTLLPNERPSSTGVPADKAGLAAALLNAALQLGGALGLAALSAIATARTNHLIDRHDLSAHAMTAGFQRALLVGGLSVLAATAFGLRTRNSRGEQGAEPMVVEPELAAVPQPT